MIGCAAFEGAQAVVGDQTTLFVLLKTCILTRHWIREGRPFRRYYSLTALGVVDHYYGSLSVVRGKEARRQVGLISQQRVRDYHFKGRML